MYISAEFYQQCVLHYNDNGYVPFVVIIIRPFPHLWFITGFVTRVTRQVQELMKVIPETHHAP